MSATRKKPRVMYMHTIEGRPATFDGEGIALATTLKPVRLYASLRTLTRHVYISRAAVITTRNRLTKKMPGVKFPEIPVYGWCEAEVPS